MSVNQWSYVNICIVLQALSSWYTFLKRASRNLKKFRELFPNQVRLRVRFSLDNLKLDDDVLNIPLLMADQTDWLIGLALEQRQGDTSFNATETWYEYYRP